jgi:hypothetical protein
MKHLKLNGESDFDYILRLVEGKSNGVYDIDYVELFKLAFGVDISSTEARKRYYGIKMLIPYLDKEKIKNISGNEILKEYELKKVELQKEKNKIQTLRLDMNRIIRESSRTELLYEEFINILKEMYDVSIPEFKPLLHQDIKKEYILSFADSHVGKEFKSITNEYNLDIVYDRFNKLLSETIEIIQENNINKLTVLALGDVIEGMCLRVSMLQQLKIGIVQQTIQFMRFIVSWLSELSKYVEVTYYQAPYANHSQIRPFGIKTNDFASEDMEKIIFAYIHDILENNSRINIVECEEKYIIFKIFNYNMIACHGHDIRNIDTFLKDISSKYRIFFDYGFFAHKHSSNIRVVNEGSTNNCEVINIPSIMGSDDYADDLLVGSKAGATLIEFNEKQGKRKTYDIILN